MIILSCFYFISNVLQGQGVPHSGIHYCTCKLRGKINPIQKFAEPYESFTTTLSKLCEADLEEKDLLNYLNTFVKLLQHYETNFDQVQLSRKDILIW